MYQAFILLFVSLFFNQLSHVVIISDASKAGIQQTLFSPASSVPNTFTYKDE